MNNYKLINERWQAYVSGDNLEEQFNRELNKLLKELQVLNEQNEPGMMGKIAQKVGTFLKSAFDKIATAIKNAPKTAVSLVTKLVGAAKTFLRDPKNRMKILSAVKAVGVIAILAAALYSPDVRAAVVDPESGKTIGPGGSEVFTNAVRGSLTAVADALNNIVRTDIDPKALSMKQEVLSLISKINSPEKMELTELQKYILRVTKISLQVVIDYDKEKDNDHALTRQIVNYGKIFQDFIITKIQGITTEFKGTLPGEERGPAFGGHFMKTARELMK